MSDPRASKERKFVSVQCFPVYDDMREGSQRRMGFTYVAVADDGTAWESYASDSNGEQSAWTQIPSICGGFAVSDPRESRTAVKPWAERIAEARVNQGFSDDDHDEANAWVDCACGQQDPRIPRYKDGAPVDDDLRVLGMEFAGHVDANDFDYAEAVLAAIEIRSKEILAALARTTEAR